MPIRYNGQDNRLVYGNVPVKSVMLGGGPCIYGDEIGYSTIFIYSEKSDGNISIDGLTEKGKTLVQIIIPQEIGGKSVVSISDEAFLDNQVMQIVTIPPTITDIGASAFEGCSYLTQINWNAISVDDFTSSDHAFYNVGKLGGGITVVFGDNVQRIPAYAFSAAANIKNVNIGSNVISIGERAFYGCSNLTEINWNAVSVADLDSDSYVFLSAGTAGDGIAVTFGESVEKIPAHAFQGCSDLTSVTIGNSVTSIGMSAFQNCSSLTSIPIPDSVMSIGSFAFYRCTSLTSVVISDSVTAIGIGVFSTCSALTSITVTDGNAKYHSAGNCIIETATKTLIAGCKTSVIPDDDSVTSIGEAAFEGCGGLASVAIPNSVTRIGEFAFNQCAGLTSVTIGNAVTSIGNQAFRGCTGLTDITIPDSVTSIGWYAFQLCSNLTYVKFMDITIWQVSQDSSFSNYTSLSVGDLANSATAATYLTSTYYAYYWRKV